MEWLELKTLAKAHNESVNGFINRAITRDYGTGQRRSCGF